MPAVFKQALFLHQRESIQFQQQLSSIRRESLHLRPRIGEEHRKEAVAQLRAVSMREAVREADQMLQAQQTPEPVLHEIDDQHLFMDEQQALANESNSHSAARLNTDVGSLEQLVRTKQGWMNINESALALQAQARGNQSQSQQQQPGWAR